MPRVTMDRLLVRKLPGWLRPGDKESLLKYFGAVEVTVMSQKGKMRNCAFATFANPVDAKMAMTKLHQLDVFGSRLIVVFATPQDLQHSSVEDKWECDKVNLDENNDQATTTKPVPPTAKQDSQADSSPRLTYLYPPPNQNIITNMANTIASVPKLYTQTLHLMNKMNLPPPFGSSTPAPVLPPGPNGNRLSSGESELDSDEEGRGITKRIKSGQKRQKMAKRRSITFKQIKETILPSSKKLKEEERYLIPSRKIEIKAPLELPSVTDASINVDNIYTIAATPISTQSAVVMPTQIISGETEAAFMEPQSALSTSAMDLTSDEAISTESMATDMDTVLTKDIHTEEQFITLIELQSNRATTEEIEENSAFKNYTQGEPSMRLYIKNLAKQATETDLRYIYGSYINWDSEADKNSFDVRVMQQGRMKGQAFVGMPSEEVASRALQDTHGYKLYNRPMVVQFARSNKPKDTI